MGLFYDDVPEARESRAWVDYLETLYGSPLLLDDALIEEDIAALEAFAVKESPRSILDAGCGTGDLLRRLCAATGAEGVGVDPSGACLLGGSSLAAPGKGLLARVQAVAAEGTTIDPVIRGGLYGRLMARERLEAGEWSDGDLRFVMTPMEECRNAEGPFDLIVAIDSFEFCRDPLEAADRLLSLLSPGGSIMIAHTERLGPGETLRSPLDFSLTRVADGFRRRGLRIRGRDITRSEKLHWRLSDRLLPGLAEACAAEGNPRVHERAKALTEAGRDAAERDAFRRYWYRIQRGED